MATTNTNAKPKIEPAPAPASAVKTAKLFRNGRSQAVRLPKEFRFEGKEVRIRRDPATGEIVIGPAQPGPSLSFDEWLALYDAIPDGASEEVFVKLPPTPKGLTPQQQFKIFDRATYPEDFFERRTSMPRKLDLF